MRDVSKQKMFRIAGILVTIFVVALIAFGGQLPEQALNSDNPRIQEMMAAQEAATPELMAYPDVLGTAVGQDFDGELTILVYVNVEGKNMGATVRSLPPKMRGKRVTIELTEPFRSMMKGKPGSDGSSSGGVSHTAKQATPIQLGTSGGWRYDLANGYCCGGTLGSLIQFNGKKYILSNYHVFESDTVPGGNNRIATDGDYIIQPGLIDVSCNASGAQNVATLYKTKNPSLPNSNVDASAAEIIDGQVRADGTILEIGTLSSTTVGPFVNQAVKKSGRTTGLSRSKVSGLNATVSVAYENECAGGSAFTKTFTGQIMIGNRGSKFLAAGDSGSLMVEDVTTNPRAVGLLFAGSSSLAVANPIGEVLKFFNATMVGN